MKSNYEMSMMLLVTGLTNFAMLPTIVMLYQERRPFEAFIGSFTMITSFMYHCCDSIDQSLWLKEGQWHRLDNIGAIMAFVGWLIYLMDMKDAFIHQTILYTSFGVVLVLQEKAPWDERYTIFPIVFMLVALILKYSITGKIPSYQMKNLRTCFVLLGIGIICFIRGLDDKTDPFRFFHGCWHFFVASSSFFGWKILRNNGDDNILPVKIQ